MRHHQHRKQEPTFTLPSVKGFMFYMDLSGLLSVNVDLLGFLIIQSNGPWLV